MVMESIITKPEESTKENGFKIKNKVMALQNTLTRTNMKDTGSKASDLAKELMNTQTEILTQVSGRMIQKMVMVFYKWPQEIDMRVIGLMERKMVLVIFLITQENTVLLMVTYTKETLKTEIDKAKESTHGQTIATTRENGLTIR